MSTSGFLDIWRRYRLRVRRQRLIMRALRKRHELTLCGETCPNSTPEDILGFATVRNEIKRLPYFLDHHRDLGVAQFYIVDNDSDDGTREYLLAQNDVCLWTTGASYRAARFGMDWINGLLLRFGAGHWCLTLDADEALVIPHMGQRNLHDLTSWLDQHGRRSFATLMLDMYPKGRLSENTYSPGAAFSEALPHYDAGNYRFDRHPKYQNLSIRGGVRQRVFFEDRPELAPHLHKTPLIKWHWRDAYASSTHIALPTMLNDGFEEQLNQPTGVLIHAKFLDEIVDKSAQELLRREHFTHPGSYDDYYKNLVSDPVLMTEASRQYRGWEGLEHDGLLTRGSWA